MILEFSIRNFFSFKETSTISFKLPSHCPEEISAGLDVSKVICLKGKNASGKTNILKAVSFLSSFCTDSFTNLQPDSLIPVDSFFDNEEPSEFQIEFQTDNANYIYELEVTERDVIRETLYRKVARKTKLLERSKNKLSYLSKELSSLRLIKLRNNVSVLSAYKNYELDDLKAIDDVLSFFSKIHSNVSYVGLRTQLPDVNDMSKVFFDAPNELLAFVKEIIMDCDTGVVNIEIYENKNEEEISYYPFFIHDVNGENFPVAFHTESSGTKALFLQLARYKYALMVGGLLCLDEFDINLHPHILPKLIDLFLDPVSNKKGAQFIFTTHNTDIMEVLGRYRTYLVEKFDNSSFAYRLDEIPGDILRNDRPITPVYNSGKIGGVPKL
jgi:hypothetical protein